MSEEPRGVIKPRLSRKAPAIKTAVTLKRLQGHDKTRISRELGIARNTVTAILEENDVERLMQDGQTEVLRRVPAALDVLDVRLEKNSENAAIWLLDKCFDAKNSGRKPEPGLTLAIQNLMGNVTVQATETKQVVERQAIEVSNSSSALGADNKCLDAQK